MNKIVAIVGMAGSGKSIASSYFNNKGYNLVYFGGVIYEKMKEEGIEITPESQKEFREKIRKEHGMGVVAKLTHMGLTDKLGNSLSTVIAIVLAMIVYVVVLILIGGITKEEIEKLPKGKKLSKFIPSKK